MSIVVNLEDETLNTETDETQDVSDNLENEIVNDDLPDKFKGKTATDVAKAYSELEKRFGQQGNELGELRRLTDDILKRQLSDGDTSKEISDDDFYEAPKQSVEKIVENHPKLNRLDEIERKLAEREFVTKHPNWKDSANTEEFNQWVSSSPMRVRLYNNANRFDFDSANDLFDLWEERQSLIKQAAKKEDEIQKSKRKEDLKKVSSESTSTDGSSEKTYRRSDLIKMKMYEPDEYAARQEEILQAYAEGRVK